MTIESILLLSMNLRRQNCSSHSIIFTIYCDVHSIGGKKICMFTWCDGHTTHTEKKKSNFKAINAVWKSAKQINCLFIAGNVLLMLWLHKALLCAKNCKQSHNLRLQVYDIFFSRRKNNLAHHPLHTDAVNMYACCTHRETTKMFWKLKHKTEFTIERVHITIS